VHAPAVRLDRCSKRFGERVALRRVTLAVEPGECVALLGANGSGKSTLLRVVAGLVRPTAGSAEVGGVAATDLAPGDRAAIGYVAHRPLAWRGLSARENLRVLARLARVNGGRVDELLDTVGLADRADDRIDGFSRGMLQRLAIARALLGAPRLLLLDEPGTGLDADGQALLERIVQGLQGTATILLSTHDPEQGRRLAGRAVTLVRGELA
jgi:ABC-2 type transport system ATP-binding protein